MPSGLEPCACCGSTAAPLRFRAWTRVYALLLFARERGHGAYVCRSCARTESARALLATACFGWWSLQSLVWLTPRATLRNWRSTFTHPVDPGRWGAIHADAFRARVRASARQPHPQLDELIWHSPLRDLSRPAALQVSTARDLYEHLGAAPDADLATLRRAYRARCAEVHNDVDAGADHAATRLATLRHAWRILREPELRAAYDWLLAHHARELELVAA